MTGRWLRRSSLALGLALLMLLSACSKNTTPPKEAPKDSANATQQQQQQQPAAPVVAAKPVKTTVTIHYWRKDGNYEDLDVLLNGDTAKPYKFWEQDKFGIKATVGLDGTMKEVKFLIRKQGKELEKEATLPVANNAAEIWVVAGNDKLLTTEADAMALKPAPKESALKNMTGPGAIIHYKRADGNYKGWDIWVWPEGGEGKAFTFNGSDEFGAMATINLDQPYNKIGYLIRCCNGKWDVKDWGSDRFVQLTGGKGEVWAVSGRENTFLAEADAAVAPADVAAPAIVEEPAKPADTATAPAPAGQTQITIHYIRADGDYTGWDLWTWGDGGADARAVAFDQKTAWGVKATYVSDKPVAKLGFIVRKGGDKWEAKDIDTDRFIETKDGKAEVWIYSGQAEVSTVAPAPVAKSTVVVHYNRPDGDYSNWDLWTWADGVDGKAFAFDGKDDYGATATVVVNKAIDKMGFIVRKGGDKWEAKDPDADRNIVLKDGYAEVWLASGKADVMTQKPATKTDVTIHYLREDGKYDGWDLWVWADGIDGKAYAFTGTDGYGAKATFTLDKPVDKVSFIVRKGGDKWEGKDVDADRSIAAMNGKAEAYLISGKADVLTAPPVLSTDVTLHYYRADGNYADWDLWVWADGVDGQAQKFTAVDAYGAKATFKLNKPVAKVSFIVRKGGDKWEAKDPDGDRSVDVAAGKAEAWLVSGAAQVYAAAPAEGRKTALKVHYSRTDGDYTNWDLWVWGPGLDGQAVKFDAKDDFGGVATLTVDKLVDNFGFLVRKGGDKWEAKDWEKDRTITVVNGAAEIWIRSGMEPVFKTLDEAKAAQ